MERPCVIFGKEIPAGAAFAASGCTSVLDFLSSMINSDLVQYVELTDRMITAESDCLYFLADRVRDREEKREAGSFVQFLCALPASCTRLRLMSVEFGSEDEMSSLFTTIGSQSCTLCELWIGWQTVFVGMGLEGVQTVVRNAFSTNTSLVSVTLNASEFSLLECLIPALRRTPCSIKNLSLILFSIRHRFTKLFPDTKSLIPRWENDLCKLFTGLASNDISLSTLDVSGCIQPIAFQFTIANAMCFLIKTNESLESLAFEQCHFVGQVIKMLFHSLEQNTHLTHLSFLGCLGPDWPPTASFVLDSLRVNETLKSLDLRNTSLEHESAAAIDALLARNKQRLEDQVPAFRAEASTDDMVQPTTLRLFLCGLPFAGKTTLSRSLVRWNASAASNSTKCLPCARMKMPIRTRGIEISSLERDGVRVCLWDLAGQPEYHAFHDYMFPDLSNDAAPSLFLFVWSPIEISSESKGQGIRGNDGFKLDASFKEDFTYWLRFIASKTLNSQKFKPKLVIAITRADLFPPGFSDIKYIISGALQKCQSDFQNHIEIDVDRVFEMDARKPRKVDDFGRHLLEQATLILESKRRVYKVCNQAREKISDLVQKNDLAPLVTKKDFVSLCENELGLVSDRMQEAVALSLNESGDLIYFKGLDLVVTDSHWFCQDFMGNLLDFGDKTFECRQHGGFFPPQYFEVWVEKIIKSSPTHHKRMFSKAKATQSLKIKGGDLVRLLIGLELACMQDDDQESSTIFIPASLCTSPEREVNPREYLSGAEGNQIFMGRRLRCKDSICTFFTRGIFTRLQVTFHKLLHDRNVLVHLQEDVIAFAFGGVKVFMEFYRREGEEHFIDILVSSAKNNVDATLEWLQKHVILDVEKVCASSRGIQGVKLAYAVIQPASIQDFLEASRRPIVLIEELQAELKNHVEQNGIDNGVKTAMYTWQIGRFPSNSVVELLGAKETSKVIRPYLDALSSACTEISNIFIDQEAESSQPQKPQFGMSPSSKERESIYDRVCRGEQNVMKELNDLKLSVEDLHNAVQDLRNAVLPKLREIFTFVREGEAGKLPRMFLVTEDDGPVQRVVSAIVPGLQNVRLQLFCECRSAACHFVDGKRGMSLAKLDEGLLRRGLPYINAFLKAVYVAARVAAHVAVGYGDVIPDFTRVLANIVDAPVWPSVTYTMADDPSSGSRVNCKEGQQWLFEVLSKRHCTEGVRIYEKFGLRRVRLPGSVVAWVCDEHYGEGTPWPA